MSATRARSRRRISRSVRVRPGAAVPWWYTRHLHRTNNDPAYWLPWREKATVRNAMRAKRGFW